MNPLRKSISLGGATWSFSAARDRYIHCRDYVHPSLGLRTNYWKDSRSTWLKLWILWNQMQPTAPSDVYDSFAQLNSYGPLPQLDAEIKQANADGIPVILTVYHAYPTWSSPTSDPTPTGFERNMRRPDYLDANSPYGWFLGWLFARYRYGAPVNSTGPRQGAPMGNPLGAYITAVIPVNEPNLSMWPSDSYLSCHPANMMRTARDLSYYWAQQAPVQSIPTYVLGPATTDSEKPHATPYAQFTSDVLDNLAGWDPRPVYVGWAHHNYLDVEQNSDPTRVKTIRDLLYSKNWKGGVQNRYIWLTEGGYRLPGNYSTLSEADRLSHQTVQAQRVENNYQRMLALPDVYMWTQYGMDDLLGSGFKSYLRDDYNLTLNLQGAPRKVFYRWLDNVATPASTGP